MQEFIKFAKHLAHISEDIIMRYFRTGFTVDAKGDGSPVTIADRGAEEVMREAIMKEFPSHGIIGEEFDDHQPDATYQWTLDPIDGTRNFVAGGFLFGTMIGLLENGKPVLGVIHHPVAGQSIIGAAQETKVNDVVVRARPCTRLKDALLLSSDYYETGAIHGLDRFTELTQEVERFQTWGDCHGYYQVASGYADIMVDAKLSIWDVAPLVPIMEGAGGNITDWYGNDPMSSKGANGAIATAGDIHDAVVAVLNGK